MKNEVSIKDLINWIDNSGIQDENGGVYSWWDVKKQKYGFFYSEITGYFITLNIFLYKIYKTNNFLLNAENAANWIENIALLENGGVLTRKYIEEKNDLFSFEGKNIFSFDNGMVLTGFCYLFKQTKKEKYLKIAKKIADFMISNFISEGKINPIFNLSENKYIINNSKWSFQQGSFLNKVAISFYEYSQISKDKRFEKEAINICENSHQFIMKGKNFFVTNKNQNYVEIHPLCYSLEGIFFIGTNCKIEKYKSLTIKVLDWIEEEFKKNKNIFETFDVANDQFLDIERSDIYGQVLRLLKITGKNNKIEKDLEKIILSMICASNNIKEKGGIFYDSSRTHINSWSTMFNLQALILDNKNIFNKSTNKIELLV